MKKILFLIAVIFVIMASCCQNVTAQNDSTSQSEYVTDSDVEKLVDKYSGKIEATLTSLAETLKQPTEHVYMILIKQQYVHATLYSLCWIFTFILIYAFSKVYPKSRWKEHSSYLHIPEDEKFNKYATLSLIYGVLSLVFLLISIFNTDVIIQGFINPEYGAIMEIIELFK